MIDKISIAVRPNLSNIKEMSVMNKSELIYRICIFDIPVSGEKNRRALIGHRFTGHICPVCLTSSCVECDVIVFKQWPVITTFTKIYTTI